MISIQNFPKNKIVRYIADLIEPFIVKQIQREHHTFFVYRCSDYNNLNHLLKCHKLNMNGLETYKELVDKYWTAIDLIYFIVAKIPTYTGDKQYFDTLRELNLQEKIVIDISLYEVKLTIETRKPNLSVKTYELMNELKKLGKDMRFVHVKLRGDFAITFSNQKFDETKYCVRTHYGRKEYYLEPRFET
ncbi:MAG: hypothetical protein KJ583_03805 [Nanoarchaeota archaeon]|nr:hypothetical protein [Nanoarchaeota archaeon]MBU1269533.1 hypothetical protein [Nanoarchaeota archaeon]MBU1604417.1 hypothetical protein [Nanoarchaeota archaeon]MBU2442433.1 hypothetical protein [Nanoarchaeota archaeon]